MMRSYQKDIPTDTGWSWMIAFGAAGALFVGVGITNLAGLFFLAFQDLYGGSASNISWIIFARGICGSITPVIAGGLGRRFGSRPVLMLVGIVGCAAFVTTSFSTSIPHAVITFGVFYGSADGMILPLSLGLPPMYFDRMRARANSLVLTGAVLGSFALSPLWVFLTEEFSIRGAFLLYGGCFLHVSLFAALLRPIEFYTKPKSLPRTSILLNDHDCTEERIVMDISLKDKETSTQSSIINEITVTAEKENATVLLETTDKNKDHIPTEKFTLELSLFRDPLFVLFLVGGSLSFFSYQGPLLAIPPHLREIGIKPMNIAYFLSTVGISDLVGRLLWGFVLDIRPIKKRIRVSLFYSGCIVISALSTICLPYIQTYIALLCYAVILGFVGGQIMTQIPLVLIEFIGTEKLTNALGYASMAISLGQALSPLLMGWMYDSLGSYCGFFTVLGTSGLVGGTVFALSPFVHRFKRKAKGNVKL